MSETKNINTNTNHEIYLKDIILKIAAAFSFLISRWIIIVGVSILGSCLGLIYALVKKPVYKAVVSFALEDEKNTGGLGAAMGLASQFGIDLGTGGGSVFTGDNLLGLMKSRMMVQKTLLSEVEIDGKKESLAELYISFKKLRKGWEGNPGLRNILFLPDGDQTKFTRVQDSILSGFYTDIIRTNLFVDREDKKISIITVKINSENEIFAKYFAETLVKNVSDFYVATKTKKSVQNVSILQRQTDSVRMELNLAITGVASSADVNPNPNPSLQILKTPSQKRQIDVQANTAILTQLVTNLELSKITLRKETPLIQVIDTPILPLEVEKVGKAKGLIYGGLIAGFSIVLTLLLIRTYKSVMAPH